MLHYLVTACLPYAGPSDLAQIFYAVFLFDHENIAL